MAIHTSSHSNLLNMTLECIISSLQGPNLYHKKATLISSILGHPNETVSGFKQDTHNKSPSLQQGMRPYSIIYLDRTPIFEGCVIRLDLRIDTKQDTGLNETGLYAQTLSTISRLNSQHNWGELVIHIKNRHICTFDNYN